MFISSSEQAFHYLRRILSLDVEEFWIIALHSNNRVIESKCLFRGTVDFCLIHPRDIVRFACVANASSVILSHNHPSGDPNPSPEDIQFTKKIKQILKMMEIRFLDHIIICEHSYYSFTGGAVGTPGATERNVK